MTEADNLQSVAEDPEILREKNRKPQHSLKIIIVIKKIKNKIIETKIDTEDLILHLPGKTFVELRDLTTFEQKKKKKKPLKTIQLLTGSLNFACQESKWYN